MIDLHTHTTESDGSFSPKELVLLAKEIGLNAIAICDHDTSSGLEEAILVGQEFGIEVVPAIELSCDFEEEMHIVGLFIDKNNIDLQNKLVILAKNREIRNLKTLKVLNSLGFDIEVSDILKFTKTKIWGRAHFARVLYEKGYVESVKDAFKKYLGHNRVAYIEEEGKMTPKECIELILKANGIPILAHLHFLKQGDDKLFELLIKLKSYGLMGIEVKYTEYTSEQEALYNRFAEKLNLLKSGGSDFHGLMKPNINLGTGHGNLCVPEEYLEKIKENLYYVRTFKMVDH
jgi:hypothetical protein